MGVIKYALQSKNGSIVKRRKLLQTVGAGVGVVGGLSARTRAKNSKVDEKVLVQTTDIYGNPDQVRSIPAERYRRLKVYEQLPAGRLIDANPPLDAILIVQRSEEPTDVALEFILHPDVDRGREDLPSEYGAVPVVTRETELNHSTESITGGLQCSGDGAEPGTTTVVGYDQSTDEKVTLTARHVTEGGSDLFVEGGKEGVKQAEDTAIDAISYEMTNPSFGEVGVVKEIQDITGTWTFAGLADTVGQSDDGDSVSDGDTVPVDFYGDATGVASDECNNTKRTGKIEYQADMANNTTQDGDSGGSWVDENGKLLSLHVGTASNTFGDTWSYGAVGGKVFDRLNVGLSPSSIQ